MTGRGRKSKYETHVKPFIPEIEKWVNTMTEQQICQRLGVGKTAFNRYKAEFPELENAIKKGRQDLVSDLHSSLIKRARGFTYEEKKVIEENGVIVRREITQKYYPPDVAALNLALKNYDKENWSNDPQMLEIRKKELKLREKQIENNDW